MCFKVLDQNKPFCIRETIFHLVYSESPVLFSFIGKIPVGVMPSAQLITCPVFLLSEDEFGMDRASVCLAQGPRFRPGCSLPPARRRGKGPSRCLHPHRGMASFGSVVRVQMRGVVPCFSHYHCGGMLLNYKLIGLTQFSRKQKQQGFVYK